MFTDLAEVMSVTPAAPAPGPPKKTDDKSFFDVCIFFVAKSPVFLTFFFSCEPVVARIIFVQRTQQLHRNGLKSFKPVYNK